MTTLYLIRHGQDNPTVRGGWSNSPLTEEGVRQAASLAEYIALHRSELGVHRILSSDLPRAQQTAQAVSGVLRLPIELRPEFREVNNGLLAGMDNELAKERYPGLFWSTLGWDEAYPSGESPRAFHDRIVGAWKALSNELIQSDENAVLVTHSGVIHVIRHLILGTRYSNAEKQISVPHAELIPIQHDGSAWSLH